MAFVVFNGLRDIPEGERLNSTRTKECIGCFIAGKVRRGRAALTAAAAVACIGTLESARCVLPAQGLEDITQSMLHYSPLTPRLVPGAWCLGCA